MSGKPRWLAVYIDHGNNTRAAMITPDDPMAFPFGVDAGHLNLPDYNPGGALTLVEMPDDPEFRPMIVDCDTDEEAPLHFIDL